MNPANRDKLAARVTRAAEASLSAQGYVSPLDVLTGIGWADVNTVKRWRQGQIPCLEQAVQSNLSRITEAMKIFQQWATGQGLRPGETQYVARTPQRQTLRFSHSGDATIELFYRTHWISPALPEKKRERLQEQANRPPELVVIRPLHDTWACHRCGTAGSGLLIMENDGPACLRCTGLDDLTFLPSGDALLTRRMKEHSKRFAVVLRFSRNRGRYERQGLLVEPQALAEAQHQVDNKRGPHPPPQN